MSHTILPRATNARAILAERWLGFFVEPSPSGDPEADDYILDEVDAEVRRLAPPDGRGSPELRTLVENCLGVTLGALAAESGSGRCETSAWRPTLDISLDATRLACGRPLAEIVSQEAEERIADALSRALFGACVSVLRPIVEA